MKSNINVLMVGSNTNVKGGMTTLTRSFLNHQFSSLINLTYIASHTEKGRIYNSFFFVKSLISITFNLIFKNQHIVHLHMSDKGSFVRKYIIFKISRLLRKKVIIHAHGGNFKEYYLKVPKQMKTCIKDMLRNADKIIALGSNWEKILLEIEPMTDVAIVTNSVKLPKYEEKSRDKQPFVVLFLAVMNEEKGIMDLIQASASLIRKAAEKNKELLFEIAGDGEMLERAKEMVAEYHLENFYHFNGWVNDEQKKILLQKSDLFVLPSYYEGLPMSVLEAISYGIPVIATNVGSIDEAVKEGKNGYLIVPGDVSALEDRLQQAIFHPAFEDMRKASRKLAEEKFDEEQYFKKIEDLYLKDVSGILQVPD